MMRISWAGFHADRSLMFVTRALTIAAAATLGISPVGGQTATTGNIIGYVRDASGGDSFWRRYGTND